jgi:hypothetical protein
MKLLMTTNKFVRLLLIDFSKSFDHIDHNKLSEKIENHNVHPVITNWFRSFLSNRQHRVKIHDMRSEWTEINSGVQQGTLCGPELFIHMVGDLQTCVPNVKFVDYTTFVETCTKGEPSELQQTTDKIIGNHLNINTSKTKELIISFGKKPQDIPHRIMEGEEIERVTENKLLDVIISNNLKWDAHLTCCSESLKTSFFTFGN